MRRAKGSRGLQRILKRYYREVGYLLYSREEATEKSQVGRENTYTEDAAASKKPVSFARKSSKYGGKSHCGLSDFFQVNKNGEPCVRDPG